MFYLLIHDRISIHMYMYTGFNSCLGNLLAIFIQLENLLTFMFIFSTYYILVYIILYLEFIKSIFL